MDSNQDIDMVRDSDQAVVTGSAAAGREVRVVIDGAAFRQLVAGEPVAFDGRLDGQHLSVMILLSDIGFTLMRVAIEDAEERQRGVPDSG